MARPIEFSDEERKQKRKDAKKREMTFTPPQELKDKLERFLKENFKGKSKTESFIKIINNYPGFKDFK